MTFGGDMKLCRQQDDGTLLAEWEQEGREGWGNGAEGKFRAVKPSLRTLQHRSELSYKLSVLVNSDTSLLVFQMQTRNHMNAEIISTEYHRKDVQGLVTCFLPCM